MLWIAGGIGLALAAFAPAEVLARHLLGRFKIAYTGPEFPPVDHALLAKFASFDPELGWEPKPHAVSRKTVNGRHPHAPPTREVAYSMDELGGRVCPVERGTGAFRVATFGDSYCLCNEVNDDETFQAYLARELGVHVSNYGGGNYGLDQAVLRLERRLDADPAEYVIMAVTPPSIARIVSVWKHYHDFGNVLAVKPRFEIRDGRLTEVACPVGRKEELMDLASRAEYLHRHDYHYRHWFNRWRPWFPYTLCLLRMPGGAPYVAWRAVSAAEKVLKLRLPSWAKRRPLTPLQRRRYEEIRYQAKLFDEFADLYCQIVSRFVRAVRERGATPILLPLRQLRYVRYEEQHGSIDRRVMDRLRAEYPELILCDVGDSLAEEVGGAENLYADTHFSPRANRLLALRLAETIRRVPSMAAR